MVSGPLSLACSVPISPVTGSMGCPNGSYRATVPCRTPFWFTRSLCVFSLWVGCRLAIVQISRRIVRGLVFRKTGCRVLGGGNIPRDHRWVTPLLPPPPCGHSPTIFQALRGLRGGRKVQV